MRKLEVQSGTRFSRLVVLSEAERMLTPSGEPKRAFNCYSSNVEHLKDELSRHWREHKDDHHEVERNHRKLVDALGMKEVRATPSHYAKEQQ